MEEDQWFLYEFMHYNGFRLNNSLRYAAGLLPEGFEKA